MKKMNLLSASCWLCHHAAVLPVDRWPDDAPVPSFGPRMVCTACGIVGADARPNWTDRQERPPAGATLGRVRASRGHEIEARSRPPVYGFLTTAANAVVEPIHPTAMPVIALRESLPDDALNRDARTRKIVPRLESP
jgi:hypothetical protein